MNLRFLFALNLSIILLIAGCVSVHKSTSFPAVRASLTSPYFTNASAKDPYRYGNFCGPMLPVGLIDIPKDEFTRRGKFIADIEPLDDIDEACKVHDLCYERYGHDTVFCDNLMAAYSNHSSLRTSFSGNSADRWVCEALEIEIVSGVWLLKTVRVEDEYLNAATRRERFVGTSAFAAMKLIGGGYPAEAGHCNKLPEAKTFLLSEASEYHSHWLQIMKRNCRQGANDTACERVDLVNENLAQTPYSLTNW